MADLSASPYTDLHSGDHALAWIDLLFHGQSVADATMPYAKSLVVLAEGLRHALGIYNVGMLVLAAALLFYQVAVMIAETAHEGIPLGQRTNKIWAPIRIVLAIGLLAPVSSGLSVGQYIIVKLGESGSTMASHAWQTVAMTAREELSTLVAPRAPNVAAVVATATEMELCRALYQTLLAQNTTATNDVAGAAATPATPPNALNDLSKSPAGRMTPEIWRYGSVLNPNVPMCGEYQFSGFRPYGVWGADRDRAEGIAHAAQQVQSFAHSETTNLITSARMLAAQIAPGFLTSSNTLSVDMRSSLSGLIADTTAHVDAALKDAGIAGGQAAVQLVDQASHGGWLAAVGLIPDLMCLQESFGELTAHALPEAIEPLLSHGLPARQELIDALNAHPLNDMSNAKTGGLIGFYAQMGRILISVRQWIDDAEIPKGYFVTPTGLDLRDHLTMATDATAAFGMYAAAMDTAGLAEGVWGHSDDRQDAGNPFSTATSFATVNPFTALAEFGRRQYRLGIYLLGLAGNGLLIPGASAAAALTGVVGLGFLAGGLGLIFVIPFLPFLRYLMAALVWLLNLFEAVVAMPIVALAHLTPSGDGLSGSAARQAYRLWLALIIRPLLTLAGLVIGFLLLAFGFSTLIVALTAFAHNAASNNGGLAIVANVALVLMFDVLAYAVTNAAFKGITWLPDQALRWISPYVATDRGDSAPVVVTGAGGIPMLANAEVTNLIGTTGGVSGINAHSASSHASASSHSTAHRLKAALFPSYADKPTSAAGATLNNVPPANPASATPVVNLTTAHVTLNVAKPPKTEKEKHHFVAPLEKQAPRLDPVKPEEELDRKPE